MRQTVNQTRAQITGQQAEESVIRVGSRLPPLELPPLTRATLALYAGASADHNPIHIDSDFAKAAGMDDVFAHGMLSMAWLGRLLTNWQPQCQLRQFSSKFVALTHIHDVITCSGEVTELLQEEDRQLARVSVRGLKADGTRTVVGEALVELP